MTEPQWEQRMDLERGVVFVLPVDDVVLHETGEDLADCVCKPQLETDIPTEAGPVTIVYHSALDGRGVPRCNHNHGTPILDKYVAIQIRLLVYGAAALAGGWASWRWLRRPWLA